MSYCAIIENPDATEETFERMKAYMRDTGPFPPDGQQLLIAGPRDTGWRVVSVWDSEEALDRFYSERLTAACRQIGIPFNRMTRTTFEVQTLVAGDLTGAPQPA